MKDFENELKKQLFRELPRHWRVEIMAAAEVAGSRVRSPHRNAWWELLWPAPKAWASLAAAWVMMMCFHIATLEGSKSAERPETVQIRMAVEEKRVLQAEMEEAAVHLDRENPKPRSEASYSGTSA